MRPSDKFLSDLDNWATQSSREAEGKHLESLRNILSRSLPGASEELVSGILARWSVLRGGPEGGKRSQAWLEAAGLLMLQDYDDEPPLAREDWAEMREIVSAEAEILDMGIVSYVMERVLDHGGF